MDDHAGDVGDLSRQLDVEIFMVAVFQVDLFVADEQVASLFAWCDGDLCGGRRLIYRREDEVGEVITGDAIEVVGAGGETGGYELLVVVGGE